MVRGDLRARGCPRPAARRARRRPSGRRGRRGRPGRRVRRARPRRRRRRRTGCRRRRTPRPGRRRRRRPRAAARAGSGARSSWRPPWLDTTTASAPASTTARASSTVWMPLTTSGPGQASRSQARSAIVAAGSNTRCRRARRRCRRSGCSDANSSGSVVSRSNHQAGCRAPSAKVRSDSDGGIVRPLRTSRSRGPGHRGVDGEHQRLVARGAGPLDEVAARLPVAPQVQLEPASGRPAPRRRAPRSTSCPSWTARRGCPTRSATRATAGSPSVCIIRVKPVGREDQRQRGAGARGSSSTVSTAETSRSTRGRNSTRAKASPGAPQADLRAGGAVGVVEDRARRPAPGEQAQVRDRTRAGQPPLGRVALHRAADGAAAAAQPGAGEGTVGVPYRRPARQPRQRLSSPR